ncbi:hypothetical protein [Microbulbifer epialgicus]|uniref:Uncharacterized protein n=1 Tax=Microbulbifer epialgicus TaxID=393907 RepID=A0ABV4P2U9_9GAMM
MDNEHNLIRDYDITSVEVYDSQMLHQLLGDNSSQDGWADGAYYSEMSEIMLEAMGYRSHGHKKGWHDEFDLQHTSTCKFARLRCAHCVNRYGYR